MRLQRNKTLLVVIDMQERLLPAVQDSEKLSETVIKLIKGARVLGAPVIVSQQYTKGLGETVEPVKAAVTDELFDGYVSADEFTVFEKTTFSAVRTPEFTHAVRKAAKKQVLVCGIETHICVLQTAIDLKHEGYEVYVVSDCVASRKESDKNTALERMAREGICVLSYEDALFEMLADAKGPGFKQISAIVK